MSIDEGRLVAGRYRLVSRIGSGAMGIVWRAVDERLDRTVAVKQLLLPPGLNESETEKARQRAFREGRIAARLQHPNAISLYNVAEDDGQPVLVMEYHPSHSLAAVLDQRGVLSPVEVARIGAQVAAALTAAHAAGVTHRDVKPANVLLGEDGTTKLTDFGISRAVGDVTVTSTGLLAGTPAYLAPETARGQEPGPASDVFSLGATLYTAVEGQPPFGQSSNEIALLHAVASGKVIPPTQAGPLTATLNAMLQPDAAARPATEHVVTALQAVADGRTADQPTLPAAPRPPQTRLDMMPPAAAHPQAAPPRTPPQGVPAGYAATANSGSAGGKRVAVVALAIAAAVATGVLVSELFFVGNAAESRGAAATSPTPTTSASVPASSVTVPEPEPAPEITGDELEEFVDDYYKLMPDDTDEGWERLGPGLREQGKESYESFWKDFKDVKVIGKPQALGEDVVQVELDLTNDEGTFREVHHLGMVTDGGELRINSDTVESSRQIKGPDEGKGDDKDDDNKKDEDDKDDDKN